MYDDCTSGHLVKRDNLHLAIRQSAAMMKTARPATPSAHPASTSDKRCRLWTVYVKTDQEINLIGNTVWVETLTYCSMSLPSEVPASSIPDVSQI